MGKERLTEKERIEMLEWEIRNNEEEIKSLELKLKRIKDE